MLNYQRTLIIILLSAIGTMKSIAQDQKLNIRLSTDKTHLKIGEQATITLDAIPYTEDAKIVWPQPIQSTDALTIIESSAVDTQYINSEVHYLQTYLVTGFDSGQTYFPSLSFTILSTQGSAGLIQKSDSLLLNFEIPNVDTTQPFKAIKDIEVLPPSWEDYLPHILVGLGILVLAVIVYWVRKYFISRKNKPIQKPIEHYWVKNTRLLKELENKQHELGPKEFYSELTDILRDYVDNRFGTKSKEQTTAEFLATVRQNPDLRPFRKQLRESLNLADLSKFAKAQPTQEDYANALQEVKNILINTKPQDLK